MPLALYLGIDAGQGHTDAVIGDDLGNVLGRGHGGPSGDHPEEQGGRETVRQSLETAIRGALEAASAGSPAHVPFAGVHCGMTSAHADKAPILASLIKTDQFDVTSGASAALFGATAGDPGIVVLGGVGAFAYGEAWDGSKASAGGWGICSVVKAADSGWRPKACAPRLPRRIASDPRRCSWNPRSSTSAKRPSSRSSRSTRDALARSTGHVRRTRLRVRDRRRRARPRNRRTDRHGARGTRLVRALLPALP